MPNAQFPKKLTNFGGLSPQQDRQRVKVSGSKSPSQNVIANCEWAKKRIGLILYRLERLRNRSMVTAKIITRPLTTSCQK